MNDPVTEPQQTDWQRLLTPAERARMLGDIARVSLAVGARLFPDASLSDLDVSAGSLIARKSPVERLGFIERILPLLTQAMMQIGRGPLTSAATESRPVAPPVRARRVSTSAVLQAARRGPAFRFLDEAVTLISLDTPENRAVKSFLQMLGKDSAAIAQIADAEGEGETAERAREYSHRLRGLLAPSWWEDVAWEDVAGEGVARRGPPTRRAAVRPEYAHVFRERDRYQAAFRFDWAHPWLTLPARETWRLYETWCLFAVLDALGTLGYVPVAESHAGTADLFALREGRLTWTLATDMASRVTLRSPRGQRLSITCNETFAEGRSSLSHAMQPDITLASGGTLWILDAKFKPYALPGEEGDDINQMHAYRDAIVDGQGKRIAVTAWCLYSGLTDAPNRAAITYRRSEETPIGALCLRPGTQGTLTHLTALLSGWLGEAQPTPEPQESQRT